MASLMQGQGAYLSSAGITYSHFPLHLHSTLCPLLLDRFPLLFKQAVVTVLK